MADTRTTAEKLGWTADDMAVHFDALTEWTKGMSHPARVEWLANELSLHNDDGLVTSTKLAWEIITAWEAENARLDAYAKRSVEALWSTPYDQLMAKTKERA